MPSNLPQPHAKFLEGVRIAVASDDRFSALLIGGSCIHGGLHELRAVDFGLV